MLLAAKLHPAELFQRRLKRRPVAAVEELQESVRNERVAESPAMRLDVEHEQIPGVALPPPLLPLAVAHEPSYHS
jgi:hypothetical protein